MSTLPNLGGPAITGSWFDNLISHSPLQSPYDIFTLWAHGCMMFLYWIGSGACTAVFLGVWHWFRQALCIPVEFLTGGGQVSSSILICAFVTHIHLRVDFDNKVTPYCLYTPFSVLLNMYWLKAMLISRCGQGYKPLLKNGRKVS